MQFTGENMSGSLSAKSRLTLFTFGVLASIGSAQQPEPQPLKAMPYSPSLDVTNLDRSVDPCVDDDYTLDTDALFLVQWYCFDRVGSRVFAKDYVSAMQNMNQEGICRR
jgi:hypothetical protein